MIEHAVYNELLKEWAKYGYVYSTKSCVLCRLEHFEKHCCPSLKGKKVLELACNSGIFAYVISGYCDSYIGVEAGKLIHDEKHPDIDYFKQLEETAKRIANPKVSIINKTAGAFIKDLSAEDFDTLVVNFAMYHFSDDEIQAIADKILPKCNTVCIQNRSKERKIKKNSYRFWKARLIIEWLEKHGFNCSLIWGDDERTYSEIIGVKEPPKNETKPIEAPPSCGCRNLPANARNQVN